MDYRKKGTLSLPSLLEDLAYVYQSLSQVREPEAQAAAGPEEDVVGLPEPLPQVRLRRFVSKLWFVWNQ